MNGLSTRETRRNRLRLGVVVMWTAVIGGIAMPSSADDRDVLDSWRAKPNVLLILDSGAEMAHDSLASSIDFPAGADDDGRYADYVEKIYGAVFLRDTMGPDFRTALARGSKLHQAKAAISSFLERGSALNLGFSSFEHREQAAGRLAFIYRVEEDQPRMLDGGMVGDPIFMGSRHPAGSQGSQEPPYDLRYGSSGGEVFVARADPLGRNRGTRDQPSDGDIRLVSYLVDLIEGGGARPWHDIPFEERKSAHLFYHPAFDIDALLNDRWIVSGLLGETAWQDVAPHLEIDVTGDRWRERLRDTVIAEIERHSIGRQLLWVLERYEIYTTGLGWLEVRPSECSTCAERRITELRYSQHILISEPRQAGDQPLTDDRPSACLGFLNGEDSISPIVELPVPDPASGATKDFRSTIRTFLQPQTTPIFYFPTRLGDLNLPIDRRNFLPLTEAVVARGNRPLAESLREAADYFRQSVNGWDDPLKRCRDNYVVVITDGAESCEDSQTTCAAGAALRGIPVFVLVLGADRQDVDPSLDCVAATTGGRVIGVTSDAEILAALEDIVGDIEHRSRAFANIVLSPVVDQQRSAFLASFIPRRGRSIWEGHVRAYPFDSVMNTADGGPLESTKQLWDAGDVLAARWDWGDVLTPSQLGTSVDPRSMYYGVDDNTIAVRRVFAFPGDDQRNFDRRLELGRLVYGRWPDSIENESDDDRLKLRNAVDFVRGVSETSNGEGGITTLRDPEFYGWCGSHRSTSGSGCETGEHPEGIEKLGDIFHSQAAMLAYPSCTPCYWADIHGYREFFAKHRHRRSVLFVGANDGALHAFDAGLWDPSAGDERSPRYDVGSGRELFAWVPQSVMGTLPLLAATSSHRWTVDGSPSIADVWVGPHRETGTAGEWRTMLLWGQRRGGRSYVCLDVTQPDPIDESGDPRPAGRASGSVPAPSILRQAGCQDPKNNADECNGLWPQFQWEFSDDADDDGNGAPDLGQTWSRPVVTFVRVGRGGTVEDRMVVFFGGGISEHFSIGESGSVSGNFIYGLDIETGKILLKAAVQGMVPSDLQLLDLDSDGFVEKIFFGTTAGNIYQLSMEDPGVLGSATGRVESWRPEIIFSAGPDQPFFMRPTLVPAYVDAQGGIQLALLVGSGNRDNLLERNEIPHRFYAFLVPAGGSLVEDDLVAIAADSAAVGVSLMGASQTSGWFIEMDSASHIDGSEKVVSPALAFNNAVVFSTFDPGNGDGGDTCGERGVARSYVVHLVNGDPLPGHSRYEELSAPTTMVGETLLVACADGSLQTFQVGDDLDIHHTLPAVHSSVGLVDWKEE